MPDECLPVFHRGTTKHMDMDICTHTYTHTLSLSPVKLTTVHLSGKCSCLGSTRLQMDFRPRQGKHFRGQGWRLDTWSGLHMLSQDLWFSIPCEYTKVPIDVTGQLTSVPAEFSTAQTSILGFPFSTVVSWLDLANCWTRSLSA